MDLATRKARRKDFIDQNATSDHPSGSALAQGCASMHAASASPFGVALAQLYRPSVAGAPSSTTPNGEATATGSKDRGEYFVK